MHRTPWFDRRFATIDDNGLLPGILERLDDELERCVVHPRLGTPMRLVDLAYFIAEHDDHHLARLRELTTTPARYSRDL
jgi:hypothetical protein